MSAPRTYGCGTTDGNRYLDATAGLWYANVGHGQTRDPRLPLPRRWSASRAYSAFFDLANPPVLELAETLAERAPMPSKVFFGSGGSDGIDTAAKLARRYWWELGEPDRTLLVSRTAGYHGTHGFGTALGGIPSNREGFGPLGETIQVRHDSLEEMEQAFDRVGPERVAAVFVEPVIGAGGRLPTRSLDTSRASPSYASEPAALLVVDAVICAFGRLGTWFGIERWDVEPDMIVFAKGVTSGYLPLGGVMISERIAEPFWREPEARCSGTARPTPATPRAAPPRSRISSCSSATGCSSAGVSRSRRCSMRSRRLAEHDLVSEVRGGVGTMAAVELLPELRERQPRVAAALALGVRAAGVFVRPGGSAVAVSPPLTAGPEHFELIAEAIEYGLSTLQADVLTAGYR